MNNPDVPNYSDLNLDQLLAHRAAIDARIEEMKGTVVAQAQRLGLAVSDGQPKKGRGRRPKNEVGTVEE